VQEKNAPPPKVPLDAISVKKCQKVNSRRHYLLLCTLFTNLNGSNSFEFASASVCPDEHTSFQTNSDGNNSRRALRFRCGFPRCLWAYSSLRTELYPGAAKGGRAKHMTPLLKAVVRKTDRPFMHYRTPLVVTLLPGDVISLRLLRHKREVVFNLHTLYYQGVRAQAAAEKRQAP
jgi:hypothetical protein